MESNGYSNFAAIDMGTNSFHMAIVRSQGNSHFEWIGKEKEMVRLGSGAGDLNHITPDAMQRGIHTLQRFVRIAKSHHARIRAVATSAVREARNRDDFLERVATECGLNVEVIPGTEEARLIYLGVMQALPVFQKRVLVIDIGGGSTEFLIGEQGHPIHAVSLKLGAIRLTDRFFASDRFSNAAVEECRKFIRVMLASIHREMQHYPMDQMIGSSGTILTLYEMIKLSRSKAQELDDSSFTSKELNGIVDIILSIPDRFKRSSIPGLDPHRSDIIVGGAILLQEIFRFFQIDSMSVSPFALREGVLMDTLVREYGIQKDFHSIRLNSVEQMMNRYLNDRHGEIESARQISRISLLLYDALKSAGFLGGLNRGDRELLEYGALLHNVGIAVSYSSHHKHGYYIIKNSDCLLGFTNLEQEILAQVTRYHRKSPPGKKHEMFQVLPGDVRNRVYSLAAILRLAVNLDRERTQGVKDIRIESGGGRVVFFLMPAQNANDQEADLSLELWAGEMRKEMLEEALGCRVELKLFPRG